LKKIPEPAAAPCRAADAIDALPLDDLPIGGES